MSTPAQKAKATKDRKNREEERRKQKDVRARYLLDSMARKQAFDTLERQPPKRATMPATPVDHRQNWRRWPFLADATNFSGNRLPIRKTKSHGGLLSPCPVGPLVLPLGLVANLTTFTA